MTRIHLYIIRLNIVIWYGKNKKSFTIANLLIFQNKFDILIMICMIIIIEIHKSNSWTSQNTRSRIEYYIKYVIHSASNIIRLEILMNHFQKIHDNNMCTNCTRILCTTSMRFHIRFFTKDNMSFSNVMIIVIYLKLHGIIWFHIAIHYCISSNLKKPWIWLLLLKVIYFTLPLEWYWSITSILFIIKENPFR